MSELPPILNEPEEDKPPVLKSGSNFNPNSPFLSILIAIFGFVAVALIPELVRELGSFFADDSDDASPPVQQADSFPPQPLPNPNIPPAELRNRAQSGDVNAQIELGQFFAGLKNVQNSEIQAKRWFVKAANQNHADAQFELGKMYSNEELKYLPPEDVSHLAPLFTNVNPYQGFDLAQGIQESRHWGEHSIASRALAKEWLHKAAAQNHVEAIFELGKLEPGQQVQRFRQAANLGHGAAQFKLAVLLSTGEEPDSHQAIELWRKAARGGNADAQNLLGTLHRYGKLVEQDPVIAHAWLKLAADQKHPVAPQSLKALEMELTPEQIAKSAEVAAKLVTAPR